MCFGVGVRCFSRVLSSKMDEDGHISEHLRQELCGRWKSKSVRASLLGGVLLIMLVLVYTLHMGTARYPICVLIQGLGGEE